MFDATTLTADATASLSTTARRTPATRVRLAPAQRLTRAHLEIAARPAHVQGQREALARLAGHLGTQLATSVTLEAHLTQATLHPFSHLASGGLFALVELGAEALGVLEVEPLTVGALLHHLEGRSAPATAPTCLTRIEEAALGWLVLTILAQLRGEAAFAGCAPRLLSLGLDRGVALQQLDARRRHLAIQLTCTVGGSKGSARLLVPSLWLQARLQRLPVEPSPAPPTEVLAAELPATCLLGWLLLAPAEVAGLARGDVVLFGGLTRSERGLLGPGRLVAPSFELRGTFTPSGFTLTRALERASQEMPMPPNDPTVPVEVEIELTRLRVPLHQLGMVSPGAVLPLHINAAQLVTVRIGDRPVARAELVEIEGEIGARILSML